MYHEKEFMNDEDHSRTSCYLKDLLTEIASLKSRCTITYLNQKDEFVKVDGLIVDIYGTDSLDWCELSDGTRIRLDRIQDFEQE